MGNCHRHPCRSSEAMITTEPETIIQLEFDLEIPCGGRSHGEGANFHVIDQFASIALMAPCCGFRLMLCRGRADHLQAYSDVIHCFACDRDSSASKWRFQEILGGNNG